MKVYVEMIAGLAPPSLRNTEQKSRHLTCVIPGDGVCGSAGRGRGVLLAAGRSDLAGVTTRAMHARRVLCALLRHIWPDRHGRAGELGAAWNGWHLLRQFSWIPCSCQGQSR